LHDRIFSRELFLYKRYHYCTIIQEQVELVLSVTSQKFVRNYVVISDCRKLYKIMDLALVSNANTRNQFHTLKIDIDETRTQLPP
jgi:hypothetical protein